VTPPPAVAAGARAGAGAAPLRQPFAPRRVSGPSRHPRAAPPLRSRSGRPLARLLDAPFLDRLIRGRTWIALIAIALLGIVAMQVAILRLGASIGRSVSQIEQITQRNESAETAIARLEPGRNVAGEAAALGMVYPPAGDITYLRARPGNASRAAALVSSPTVPLLAPADPNLTAALAPALTQSASGTQASTTTPTTPSTPPATTPSTSTSTSPASTTTTASGGAPTTPAGTQTGGAVSSAGGLAAG
jgi:hypothetical protein